MERERLELPSDFFKQFTAKEEFQNFFQTQFKQEFEEMLKVELVEHMGYEKLIPEGHHSGNFRNGFNKEKVKAESVGEMHINILWN